MHEIIDEGTLGFVFVQPCNHYKLFLKYSLPNGKFESGHRYLSSSRCSHHHQTIIEHYYCQTTMASTTNFPFGTLWSNEEGGNLPMYH